MTGVAPEGGREVSESLTLKPISKGAIPRALEKAERYRLLNDPEQAESICLDILAADPDNQRALVMLILSITDRFGRTDAPGLQRAREYVAGLHDPYQRLYYEGLVREREARARLARPMGSSFAYDGSPRCDGVLRAGEPDESRRRERGDLALERVPPHDPACPPSASPGRGRAAPRVVVRPGAVRVRPRTRPGHWE